MGNGEMKKVFYDKCVVYSTTEIEICIFTQIYSFVINKFYFGLSVPSGSAVLLGLDQFSLTASVGEEITSSRRFFNGATCGGDIDSMEVSSVIDGGFIDESCV